MGVFYVACEISGIRPPSRWVHAEQALVDSGSEFTWIPAPLLRRAGVRVVKKDEPFVMANGSTVTRSVGYAIIRVSEFETVDEVVFGQPGDLCLLGARTLDSTLRASRRRPRQVTGR